MFQMQSQMRSMFNLLNRVVLCQLASLTFKQVYLREKELVAGPEEEFSLKLLWVNQHTHFDRQATIFWF